MYEAGGEIATQTARNSRGDTRQSKGEWDYTVNEDELESQVGSLLGNAIWEEFGSGEYILKGNGRKGGLFYTDKDCKSHFIRGKNQQGIMECFQNFEAEADKKS